jgi:hypothetical protein
MKAHKDFTDLAAGYQDSGADIAYNLQRAARPSAGNISTTPSSESIEIITPSQQPNPSQMEGWTFPDTEAGILDAIQKGANCLWANTLLSSAHPLQTSPRLEVYEDKISVFGQPPILHDKYDDKALTNNMLWETGRFTLPKYWVIANNDELESLLASKSLPLPIVAKPIHGGGKLRCQRVSNILFLIRTQSGIV